MVPYLTNWRWHSYNTNSRQMIDNQLRIYTAEHVFMLSDRLTEKQHKLTIVITQMKVVKRLAVANTLKVAPAMKQRAAALIVVRNRVNRNMKNFPASIWSPSHQHCSHSLFNPVTRYLYIKCIHFTFFFASRYNPHEGFNVNSDMLIHYFTNCSVTY